MCRVPYVVVVAILGELTLKEEAVQKLHEKSIEDFLKIATDGQLAKFIDLF